MQDKYLEYLQLYSKWEQEYDDLGSVDVAKWNFVVHNTSTFGEELDKLYKSTKWLNIPDNESTDEEQSILVVEILERWLKEQKEKHGTI